MRYYRLEFIDEKGNVPASLAANNNMFGIFESHPNGIYNPACPEISFDCSLAFGHVASQMFQISLHNVPKEMLKLAQQYNGLNVNLYAGFKTGLPLANPFQSGLIVMGQVQGCSGNWAGTNLTMEFLINPISDFGSPALNLSANIGSTTVQKYSFKWDPTKGTTFVQALNNFFQNFGYTCQGNIDAKGTYGLNKMGKFDVVYTSFDQFAKAIQVQTQQQDPPNKINPDTAKNKDVIGNWQPYRGVCMGTDPSRKIINLWDGTADETATPLQIQDFIGQPIWISAGGMVQSIHPLRNDIQITDYVTYPNQLNALIPAQFTTAARYNVLNGQNAQLYVCKVRHVGRYRDTSPNAWCTYISAQTPLRENPWANTTGSK